MRPKIEAEANTTRRMMGQVDIIWSSLEHLRGGLYGKQKARVSKILKLLMVVDDTLHAKVKDK